MPSKRTVLLELTVHELRDSADRYKLEGFDRRKKDQLVDALTGSRKARIQEILEDLPRDRLKELCRVFGLSDAGKRKADIAARLAGAPKNSKPPSETAQSAKTDKESAPNGATTGYEAQMWAMADALRGSMDAAEYKHVVLGLIFLKYISDAFEEHRAAVLAEWGEVAAEDRDEYTAQSIFWVPKEARWERLKQSARQSTIGQTVDEAMSAIEKDNPSIKDVLPKDYARPGLDKVRLGQLIDLVSNIQVGDMYEAYGDVFQAYWQIGDVRLRRSPLAELPGTTERGEGNRAGIPRLVVVRLLEAGRVARGRGVHRPGGVGGRGSAETAHWQAGAAAPRRGLQRRSGGRRAQWEDLDREMGPRRRRRGPRVRRRRPGLRSGWARAEDRSGRRAVGSGLPVRTARPGGRCDRLDDVVGIPGVVRRQRRRDHAARRTPCSAKRGRGDVVDEASHRPRGRDDLVPVLRTTVSANDNWRP